MPSVLSMSLVPNTVRSLAWTGVKHWVRQQFPQVPRISVDELAEWLASNRPDPVLIDVRQAEEFAVSHLPGAHHLPTVDAIRQASLDPALPWVLYCSVGYRSARQAQALQAVGYQNVLNLEGSIFAWHNQDYPLTAAQQPTQAVHPYNRIWGLLLQASAKEP